MVKRRRFTANAKARVAMEALTVVSPQRLRFNPL